MKTENKPPAIEAYDEILTKSKLIEQYQLQIRKFVEDLAQLEIFYEL